MLQLSFVNFRRGAALVVEGKALNDRFYIIQAGQVQCVSEVAIPGQESTMLGPGDFVGVIPCMSNHLQIETVIAMTDVTVISVMRDQYSELIAKNTPVAMKIIRTFANRMRSLNNLLTTLTLNHAVSESPEQLFNVAAFYDREYRANAAVYAYYQYLKACPAGVNVQTAKQRFIALKPKTHAVYFEPSDEMVRKYPKETMIFCENQSGADMFIIQSGEVSISKVVDGNEVTLAVLKKGDMFGEMALLENKPRSASAIAHEECTLMVVNRKNFDIMVSSQAQLIARLTTTLAERLWALHRQLTNSQIKEYSHKMVDMLALQLEKAKLTIGSLSPFQTSVSVQDLVTMCGIPGPHQPEAINDFTNLVSPRIVNGKIYATKPGEIIKAAAFYRKKAH